MRWWIWYLIPTRILKQKTEYLMDIKALKWDIWYYYTGIQLIITFAVLFTIGLGAYVWIISNGNKYIDPFKTQKNISYIINGILILTMLILNRKFIIKDAKRDDMIKVLKKILIFSIIAFGLTFLINIAVKMNINENIEEFYTANSIEDNKEEMIEAFFDVWTLEEKTIYMMPFFSITMIQYLIYILLLYNNIVWIYRLINQKNAINKTEVMFDEEENVKF